MRSMSWSRSASPDGISGEIDLARIGGSGGEDRQAHHVEAEAGVDLLGEAGEFLFEELAHELRRAERPAGADLRTAYRAVDAEERELEDACPLPARLELLLQRAGKRGEGRGDVILKRDRLGEAALGDQGGERPARVDRLFLLSERLIEPAEKIAAETGGKRRARRIHDLADALQADALQREDGVVIEAQGGKRERRDRRGRGADRDDAGQAEAGDGGGGAGRVGNRRAGEEALRLQPGNEIGAQRCLAAEKMRRAGDVEHQAVRRRQGHQRRVPLRPVGDRRKQGRIRGAVLVDDLQRRDHGAGIGERLADGEPYPLRRLIEGNQAEGTLDLRDDGEGGIVTRLCGAPGPAELSAAKAVGREVREGETEIAWARRG